jgi:hypothetical protein
VALVNYWVIGTNRETLVVVYERRFVKQRDAEQNQKDMATRFPADVYDVRQTMKTGGFVTLQKALPENTPR